MMHEEKFDKWMTAEHTKITKEKKMSMMQELDGTLNSSAWEKERRILSAKVSENLSRKASDAEFES